MQTEFRQAVKEDKEAIVAIYNRIFDAEERGPVLCGWTRGRYPTEQVAEAGIESGEMVVLTEDGRIVGSARINSEQDDLFSRAKWAHEAAPEQILVLHTLTVDPEAKGRGYGRKFVDYYEATARQRGCTELRMDTRSDNYRALRVYMNAGFAEADVVFTKFADEGSVHPVVFLEKYLG